MALPVRAYIPPEARPGDTLSIMTQLGLHELVLPDDVRPGTTHSFSVPLPAEDYSGTTTSPLVKQQQPLVVAFSTLLRDGVEIATTAQPASPLKLGLSPLNNRLSSGRLPSPGNAISNAFNSTAAALSPRRAGSSSSLVGNAADAAASRSQRLTRRVVVPVPAEAKPGESIAFSTEVGLFQLRLPAKHGKSIVAHLPVPDDCALAKLTVAWVLCADPTLAAVATMVDIDAHPAAPAPAPPRTVASPESDDAVAAFVEADDEDEEAGEELQPAAAPEAAAPQPAPMPPPPPGASSGDSEALVEPASSSDTGSSQQAWPQAAPSEGVRTGEAINGANEENGNGSDQKLEASVTHPPTAPPQEPEPLAQLFRAFQVCSCFKD